MLWWLGSERGSKRLAGWCERPGEEKKKEEPESTNRALTSQHAHKLDSLVLIFLTGRSLLQVSFPLALQVAIGSTDKAPGSGNMHMDSKGR
jgi:hypothetical protein